MSRSARMGRASHVPPGDSSRDNFEQDESELPSSSGRPTKRARRNVLDHYGGRQDVQHFSSLQLDEVKHKVFLSHSGAQKDFVEQLFADLERLGFIFSFFDLRPDSLPKGKDFAALIKEAAQHCHVAVVVLSEEYLRSKWPMIELAEFHAAQQAGNQRLNMLPLFYKLSVEDLGESAIEERWKPVWKQLASSDARIDVEKWSDAVRALRKANGLIFQKGLSEVGYRKDIVESIFKLSPPDLLYGSSRKMVGYSRLCKMMSDQFVRSTNRGPSFLGLYGASGAGKTTLSKALCDHFYGEYMGRVCHVDLSETPIMGWGCHVDLNETSRLRRVKQMLERLCGLDKKLLDRISDFDEGLRLMHLHMRREPVFVAFDNVTNDGSFWNEACEYLMVGFHPESRIVITSRSRSNIGGLVPNIELYVPMPRLSVTEAGELFLRSAAPSKSIFGLTIEERRIVGLCIQQCLFEADNDQVGYDSVEDEVGLLVEGDVSNARRKSYHPLALSALGDFFHRYFRNFGMLRWRDHLEENKDPLWELWKVPNGIGRIIGLQFHSLSPSEQLLFLDIAAFVGFRETCHVRNEFDWLCNVHDETQLGMLRRLQDLERSGMIMLEWIFGSRHNHPYFRVAHDIYKRFAEWHVTSHGVNWLKNAWCVFKSPRSTLNRDFVVSDLVRLRMFDLSSTSARLLTSKMMQELNNLEVLQFFRCPYLIELNLEGLKSLRCLELLELQNLVDVTLTNNLDMAKSLLELNLEGCRALEKLPDSIGHLTSLATFNLKRCAKLRYLPESFGNLQGLSWLSLKGCGALEKLLDSIGHLTSLNTFNLDGCAKLQYLPESFGNLQGLLWLNLEGCEALEKLPDSIGHLTSLKTFYLEGCAKLQYLPQSFGNLKGLSWLYLNECGALEKLPDSIGHLTSLNIFDLTGCAKLQYLPESFGNLQGLLELNLEGCGALEKLPDSIGHLTSLKTFYLKGCAKLQYLPQSFGNLKGLWKLNLEGCGALEKLPDSIGHLTSLKTFYLKGCAKLQYLPESFGNLQGLLWLDYEDCGALEKLPDSIGLLPSLKELIP